MKRNVLLLIGVALVFSMMVLPAFSQVSNDNEDEVYKIDDRVRGNDFIPGQVLVKFKDESTITVRQNARGKFQKASINAVDKLLRDYGVDEMQKLYPNEVAKPAAQLRKKRAPNGSIVQERNLDKVFWVKTNLQSPDSTLQLIEQLKEIPEVEYAEPNYRVYITADRFSGNANTPKRAPKDIHLAPVSTETDASVICANPSQNPLYSYQYGITQHNIHQLWDKPIINKKRPVIAILDTGVDIEHPDLKDNIWQNTKEVEGELAYDDDGNGIVDDEYGWNFADNYYDLTDRNGHGTHVAGIAAASDNSIGVVGANPQALIMPIKVMNDRGEGDIATCCRGMIYAAEMGADIINMSLGHTGLIPLTEIDAIQKAYITTILVASAGNNGASVYNPFFGPLYPAAYYLVLGVQCSGKDGKLVYWSNYDPDGPIYSEDGIDGKNHEMMLAGVDIYSTLPGGQYNKLSGTSMSAPLLSGAISALKMVKEYPSKDVLFGDLIHLDADFEKIFSDETSRTPKIDLVALNYDDSQEGNGDGQVDAGETLDFYVVLRNTWADATNIEFKMSVIDEKYKDFVQIENPEVDFGYSLSAYGRESSKTPIRVKFSENIGHNTRIKFGFEIRCDESNETIIHDVYVTVFNMVKLGGIIASDMTLTADKNYLVTSNLGIPEGVTLTIEPGTVVNFEGAGLSSCGILQIEGTPEMPIVLNGIQGITIGNSLMTYTKIKNANIYNSNGNYVNCQFLDCINKQGNLSLSRCNIWGGTVDYSLGQEYCNYVGMGASQGGGWTSDPSGYNLDYNVIDAYLGPFSFALTSDLSTPKVIKLSQFPYLGSGRKDIVRQWIGDINTGWGFGEFDLSNMPTRPYAEAHGIVWKVVVNGFDAQDEYEQLAPLGVGKHKFEVYFNRPMNKAKIPQITFGVREPFNQHSVDEDGVWNEEGTIYTAYKTITGKTMSDGVNRIYVQGAEDDEFFECPYEKTRFNIHLQAAGSMATGFVAEAGMGRVNLKWNNDNNDFEDAMGFNIYRYTYVEKDVLDWWGYPTGEKTVVPDTTQINQSIVDIETTAYTDYDVVPGTTYYYLYRVLSTDLKEYDVSNVVAATPLTSELGDANGSGDVDVADVITAVNYAAGMNPKPFIFEAADMNTDLSIDILDVIGIIKKILNPETESRPMIAATATYTIENGILYVETPVELAGVQVQLAVKDDQEITVADDLNGFEHTSAWLSDNDYLFLAYNMNGKTLSTGKHALLYLGNSKIAQFRLSDADGHNVEAIGNEATHVDRLAYDVMNVSGVYDLQGRKISGNSEQQSRLPKGVYIVNGKKVVR
jgi:subtilisin family serine protease